MKRRSRSKSPRRTLREDVDAISEVVNEFDGLKKQVVELNAIVMQLMTTVGQLNDKIDATKQPHRNPMILVIFTEIKTETQARLTMVNMIDGISHRGIRVWKDHVTGNICGDYAFQTMFDRENAINRLQKYASGLVNIVRKD